MLIERVAQHIPAHACVVALDLTRGQTAALQFFGPDWHVVAHSSLEAAHCPWRIQSVSMRHALADAPTGWRFIHRERRPTDDEESLVIYRHATTTHPTR
jgi:hypothetical protein